MGTNPSRNRGRTVKAFHKAYGYGPWSCFFCVIPVLEIGRGTWNGNIHHIDDDVTNDTADNLAMTHVLCHRKHHGLSDVARSKLSDAFRGRESPTKGMRFSAEVNAKKAHHGSDNHQFRKPLPLHTRQAISRANRRMVICEMCGVEIAAHWIRRHQASGCQPKKCITVNGVVRVRGIEPKVICQVCGKPYASRWMQRHKDNGMCVPMDVNT